MNAAGWLREQAGFARLYWRVVIAGRVAVLVVAELFFLGLALLGALVGGAYPSDVVKSTLIVPAMVLFVLCSSELVPALRAGGELELAATLSRPDRLLFHRMAPVFVLVASQVLGVVVFLAFVIGPKGAFIGLLAAPVPLFLAGAASLYWNLRLKGSGAVLAATLLSLVPAIVWLQSAYLFPDNDTIDVPTYKVVLSSLSCQAGLLMAACATAALAWRRFSRVEELLDSR